MRRVRREGARPRGYERASQMPPRGRRTCAATVCERVGKSFVIQAVLKPCSARPIAARRPAPPAPTTTASKSWSTIGYAFDPAGEDNERRAAARRLRDVDAAAERNIASATRGEGYVGGTSPCCVMNHHSSLAHFYFRRLSHDSHANLTGGARRAATDDMRGRIEIGDHLIRHVSTASVLTP